MAVDVMEKFRYPMDETFAVLSFSSLLELDGSFYFWVTTRWVIYKLKIGTSLLYLTTKTETNQRKRESWDPSLPNTDSVHRNNVFFPPRLLTNISILDLF